MFHFFFTENNVRTLTENRGIYDVADAMKTHSNSPELLEAACAVLLSLSMEGEPIIYSFLYIHISFEFVKVFINYVAVYDGKCNLDFVIDR